MDIFVGAFGSNCLCTPQNGVAELKGMHTQHQTALQKHASCISYLLLCNKSPQIQCLKRTYIYYVATSGGQEPRHGLIDPLLHRLQSSCLPGLESHSKARLGKDLIPHAPSRRVPAPLLRPSPQRPGLQSPPTSRDCPPAFRAPGSSWALSETPGESWGSGGTPK